MSGHTPELSPLPASIARVLVTGFMGAGKTTVGRMLAERLGWDFADSDHLLEARTGGSIAAIFETHGEPAFRDLEAATIRATVARDHLVLALGGGALERPETRSLLASLPDSLLIFLDAPLDVLVSRCSVQPDAPVRPVLSDRARLQERWTTRLPWYRQARLTVNTEGCTPDQVAQRILALIGDRCGSAAQGSASFPARPRTGVHV
ncbi:MAG TPA: shikimate kinase [Acidobacteriaceae bacterium]